MRCEDARLHISREIDGEPSGKQRDAAEQHVEACGDCARFAVQSQRLQCLIRDSSVQAPDSEYWTRLSARAAGAASGELRRSSARLRLYRPVSYLAAAACAVLVVVVVLQQCRIGDLRTRIERVSPRGPGPEKGAHDLAAAAGLFRAAPQQALAEQAVAFQILADYFEGGLRWVVQDGSQAELGVAAAAVPSPAAGKDATLVVEIRVLRFENGGNPRLVSAPTLMILPGEEADFRVAATGGVGPRRFRYRCVAVRTTEGKARVTVALELTPAASGEVVRLSGMVGPGNGSRVPAAYSRAGDVGYVLLLSTRRCHEPSRKDRHT